MFAATDLECFDGFKDKFMAAPDHWRNLYDSPTPESMLDDLPGEYKDKSDF